MYRYPVELDGHRMEWGAEEAAEFIEQYASLCSAGPRVATLVSKATALVYAACEDLRGRGSPDKLWPSSASVRLFVCPCDCVGVSRRGVWVSPIYGGNVLGYKEEDFGTDIAAAVRHFRGLCEEVQKRFSFGG